MSAIHFTNCGYTTIKTPEGAYSFRGTSNREMTEHRGRLNAEVARRQRQIAALDALINNESRSDPNALR